MDRFSVPILLLSRQDLGGGSLFCPDSALFETGLGRWIAFLSRFCSYRDRTWAVDSFSVSIWLLLRQDLGGGQLSCLDSALMETGLGRWTAFLSRFCFYRDRTWAVDLFPVPILLLSRQDLIGETLFCPDSALIETGLDRWISFLSRFYSYRDRNWAMDRFSVPILLLSRQELGGGSLFCPDSAFIETGIGRWIAFLSRFGSYRDRI